MDLLARFQKTIEEHNLLDKGERVLVSFSGGPDSMTLLDLLSRLTFNLTLEVFHLDHSLRPEAQEEARRMEKYIASLGLVGHFYKEDVKAIHRRRGGSLQEVARDTRLSLLLEIARKRNIKVIAMGHQADDQVESILLNLLRGSGLTGLAGIPYKSHSGIIHPLLDIWRKDIEGYCQSHSLEPIIDKSNLKPDYRRNKVRLELIPHLEEYNPNLKEVLWQMAGLVQRDDDFLQDLALKQLSPDKIYQEKDYFKIDLHFLKSLARPLLSRILLAVLKDYRPQESYYFQHIDKAIALIEGGGTGERLVLAGPLILEKGRQYLYFADQESLKIAPFAYKLTIPGRLEMLERNLIIEADICQGPIDIPNKGDPYREYVPLDKLATSILVRNRQAGDRFYPLGAPGEKKLKNFFIDAHIDKFMRDRIPLLVAPNNDIIWVCGHRLSHKYKIDENTERIIELSCRKIT